MTDIIRRAPPISSRASLFRPTWPERNSDASRVLRMLLDGHMFVTENFFSRSAETLEPIAARLREMGWPIEIIVLPMPQIGKAPVRPETSYRLPEECICEVRDRIASLLQQ